MKNIKIKTPYGEKNWEVIKKMFDSYNDLLEACKCAIQYLEWSEHFAVEDAEEDEGNKNFYTKLKEAVNKAKGV